MTYGLQLNPLELDSSRVSWIYVIFSLILAYINNLHFRGIVGMEGDAKVRRITSILRGQA
jgi:hypothetical protein